MAQINLDNYEPVEERLNRFKKDYPDFRMRSIVESMEGEPGSTRWVVNVILWKHKDDPEPSGNGHAFELDGVGMTQKAAALETCETSALGRALANIGYTGNRRVTREEMAKVERHESEVAAIRTQLGSELTVEQLRKLWLRANRVGEKALCAEIQEKVKAVQSE